MEPVAPERGEDGGSGSGWVLVLDIGSSSARAWFFDAEGRAVDAGPRARRAYLWHTEPAGAMECDAEALLAGVVSVMDGAVETARASGYRIAAVGIAAFWHSILGVGEDGKPLTPVYGWGDTRGIEEAVRLGGEVDEGDLHARTGCFLRPNYPTVRLSWLRATDPAAFATVARWISFPELVDAELLGERRVSYSVASGSGFLDVHRLDWDAEALSMAGVRAAQLSPLVDTDAAARGVRPELAARWPELSGVPWYPAIGDGAAANLGSGAFGKDRVGLTIGTSSAVRLLWEPDGPVRVPRDLWCYRLDARRWVAGAALSNGGNAVAFLRGFLHLPDEREWEARVQEMEPDSHGLTILPFLLGERGPGWRRETRSAILGATLATTPEELMRAWLEAVAYRIARVEDELQRSLGGEGEVLATGGALDASPVWAQILADVMNRTVALVAAREATARGAALVVLERLGWRAGLREAEPEVTARFLPDPARHQRYRAGAVRQQNLLEALPDPATLTPPAPGPASES
jgi:gluconokinase